MATQLLEAQLILSELSEREIAAAMGIGHNTLLAKLRGTRYFTLDEAVALKQLLHATESVEELFCGIPPLDEPCGNVNLNKGDENGWTQD